MSKIAHLYGIYLVIIFSLAFIMGLMIVLKLLLILNICRVINAGINSNNDDKLVISPVQLADMVLRERMKKKPLENWKEYTDHEHQAFVDDTTTTELNDDESRLKNRKIWSRWSKWGECSVTCGLGQIMRERMCVSGRCAHAEREEQRRPCARPPCADTDQTQMVPEAEKMLVELCLILRITLHEVGVNYKLDHVNIAPCDATKEQPHDLIPKTTLKETKEIAENRDTGIDKNVNSKKWIHNPILEHSSVIQQDTNQMQLQKNERPQPVALRAPHSITKLAKTLSYGFDPYFSKRSFEPFERRPKPITLVAFRKNGLAPRETLKHDRQESAEIAELQSPFNPVSSFWSDSGFDS